MPIRLVCATRRSQEDFLQNSALGQTLKAYVPKEGIETRLFANNTQGLSQVYNQAIAEITDDCLMVFLHDDVYLLDFYWPARLGHLLGEYDGLGLAGNRRRLPGQPGWAFIETAMSWDSPEYLSGIVGHGLGFPSQNVSYYGPAPAPVQLLDGCFLAMHAHTIKEHDLHFDERFTFDFYDLDFCRLVESRGLKMGTADLSAVHQSGGRFGVPDWQKAYRFYLEKWENSCCLPKDGVL